jgi:hypothetical protein
MENLPKDHFVTRYDPNPHRSQPHGTNTQTHNNSLQFTKNVYQDVYPSVDPTKPELSLAGKVVIITGASRGIGAKVISILGRVGMHDS